MSNLMTNLIGDKKRYRQFQKDAAALPAPYAKTLVALERYIWNFAKDGGIQDALDGLLNMFQESAAEGVPIASVVGDDPVAFAEGIMAQYPDSLWLIKYQNRLKEAVKEAKQ